MLSSWRTQCCHKPSVNVSHTVSHTLLPDAIQFTYSQIFRYLIEHGANVAAVNNDAELPLDIAESDEMEDMLQQNINAQGKASACFVNPC